MRRNDTKCKYMFMFPLKNLARKGLRYRKVMCYYLPCAVHHKYPIINYHNSGIRVNYHSVWRITNSVYGFRFVYLHRLHHCYIVRCRWLLRPGISQTLALALQGICNFKTLFILHPSDMRICLLCDHGFLNRLEVSAYLNGSIDPCIFGTAFA